jgi:GLPGLI family protein
MYSHLIADNELSFFVTQRSDFQKTENKVTQEADRIAVKVFNADEIGSYVVRDFKKESIVFREVGSKFMAPIIVSDQWVALPWNLSDETKKIGEYVCKKANCQFRGRSYTAWFTEEIPVPTG